MTGVILSDYEVNDILNEQDKEIKSLKKENEKLKQQLKKYEDLCNSVKREINC